MGRSRLIPFTISITCSDDKGYTPCEWYVRRRPQRGPADGKPTSANIAKWVVAFERSREPGQPNAHLGMAMVLTASITDQRKGEVVAEWSRLEYLRGELRAERISTGELLELQSLVDHISPDDVELLEAAGVPESV